MEILDFLSLKRREEVNMLCRTCLPFVKRECKGADKKPLPFECFEYKPALGLGRTNIQEEKSLKS
jgi:hypothetical protein